MRGKNYVMEASFQKLRLGLSEKSSVNEFNLMVASGKRLFRAGVSH
jgi:hypothetical protein